MKTIFLLTLFFILLQVHSQDLKTYEGEYKQGIAKYEYFENKDYERIFEGKFKFSRENVISILGQFKNNKKTGEWIYIKDLKKAKTSTKTKGIYFNDKKNGVWTFLYSKIINNKVSTNSIILNFKNDTVVGKVDLPNLKGEFNKSGNFIGVWNYKKDNTEYIAEFKDNTIIKLIDRRISDGFIYSRYKPNLDSISVDKLRKKDTNYQILSFSGESDSITKGFVNILGVPKDKYYNYSFIAFIKAVKEEFRDLDYNVQSGIGVNYNHSLIKNPELIIMKRVYKKTELINEDTLSERVTGRTGKSYYGNGSGSGSGNDGGIGSGYSLGNRKALNKPLPDYTCQEQGRVAVQVSVDRSGKTISVTAGVQGTTNTTKCLLDQARTAAMNTIWQPDSNAPENQIGKIIYTFESN